MEKNRKSKKFLYLLIPLVLLIIVSAESVELTSYHSISGNKFVTTDPLNTTYIIIAKLPSVSSRAQIYILPSGFPGAFTFKIPANSSSASTTVLDIHNSSHIPSFVINFNATSGSDSGTTVSFPGSNLSIPLTTSNPVNISLVSAKDAGNISTYSSTTHYYDYLVIAVTNIDGIYCTEVSR